MARATTHPRGDRRIGWADGQYMEAGILLLELTLNMHWLFEKRQRLKTQTLEFRRVDSVWEVAKLFLCGDNALT